MTEEATPQGPGGGGGPGPGFPPGNSPLRMEVDHLLARVDDVLMAFAELAPFSAREIYEVRKRSARVTELLGEE